MFFLQITALITEYNPFHNGHLYHLKQSRKLTSADYIIVIMSGNFTQRAEPALLNKWARASQALKCGADLVLELPFVYNIRSAEYFAYFAVQSIQKSQLVDNIVFGSESGDLKLLQAVAEAFNNENKHFKNNLSSYLNQGLNYPLAREKALLASYHKYKQFKNFSATEIKNVLNSPNNILAIEYLKAIDRLNLNLRPFTIKRVGSSYHSQKTAGEFASASLLREKIFNQNQLDKTNIKQLVPKSAYQILEQEIKQGRYVGNSGKKSLLIKQLDLIRRQTIAELTAYPEINTDLASRLLKTALYTKNDNFMQNLKAKNYTETRLKRNLLQIYFELNEAKLSLLDKNGPSYLRVIGIKQGQEKLLKKLTQQASLPIITNPAAFLREPSYHNRDPLQLALSYDILASDLYCLLYQNHSWQQARKDYHQPLLKV